MKGSRNHQARGIASAALNWGVATFLAMVVSRTGNAATHPVKGDELKPFSPGPARPAAM
jgi:hypothetical protein